MLEDPEFVGILEIEDTKYKQIHGLVPGNKYSKLAQEYNKAVFNCKRCFYCLYNQALYNFRKEYFCATNLDKIYIIVKYSKQGLSPVDKDTSTPELTFVSH